MHVPHLSGGPWLGLFGDIVELGAEVEGQWQVGDKVMGLAFTWAISGTYAEYVPVDATAIAHAPGGGLLPGGGAATGKPDGLAVAARIRRTVRGTDGPDSGGLGGCGQVAFLAKHLGATVYSTCSAANADYVKQRGADVVIDYTSQDYAAVIRDQSPEGVDLVLETWLGDGIAETAIRLAKDNGVVVFMNNEPPEMEEIARRGIKTQFLHHRADGAMLAELGQLYESGALPVPPIEVLPWPMRLKPIGAREHPHPGQAGMGTG